MKKLILGAALGVGIGYLVRKAQEEGFLEEINDDLNKFASKAKKNMKNALNVGENETEYIKDRLKQKTEKIQDSIKDIQE